MNKTKIEISKFEVYSVLKSRLTTQDRSPKISTYKKQKTKFHFLPKLYDKSLYCNYERSYANELVYKQIMKLKVYYIDSDELIKSTIFNEIENFKIDLSSHKLYISLSGEEKQAYTPTCKDHSKNDIKTKAYIPFILNDNTLAKATIDHNPTFIDFVYSNRGNLETLTKISEDLNKKRISKFSKGNRNKISTYINEENLTDKLWKELEFIAENQVLELVHANYNTR